MIADRIIADQEAARAILQVIGNSPQQGFEERADGFSRLGDLWKGHGAMMAALHPHLGATRAWPDPVAAASELQREVEMLADDLAAREAADDEHWRTDFVRLQTVFEQLCRIEQMELMPMVLALPPDVLAGLSRLASGRRAAG